MKRWAILFVIAVLAPCAVLAWLAVRQMQEEEGVFERQRLAIAQQGSEALAVKVAAYVEQKARECEQRIDSFLTQQSPEQLAGGFDAAIRESWPLAHVGFVLKEEGGLLSPTPTQADERLVEFRTRHGGFLQGRVADFAFTNYYYFDKLAAAPGTPVAQMEKADIGKEEKLAIVAASSQPQTEGAAMDATTTPNPDAAAFRTNGGFAPEAAPAAARAPQPLPADSEPAESTSAPAVREERGAPPDGPGKRAGPEPKMKSESHGIDSLEASKRSATEVLKKTLEDEKRQARRASNPTLDEPDAASKENGDFAFRVVDPRNYTRSSRKSEGLRSALRGQRVYFPQLWSSHKNGIVSRQTDMGLSVIVWYRPPKFPYVIFGVELSIPALAQQLTALLSREGAGEENFCFAALNEKAMPTAQSLADFTADWKHPYVSEEIGPVLPRWELAAQLLDPMSASNAAKAARLKLGMLVLAVLGAASVGAWMLVRDSRQRLSEARQKADFVSNVSHELRTPLTAINMFSGLLAAQPEMPPEKTRKYSEIIAQEAERLSRLINGVLDFSRLEKGGLKLNRQPFELGMFLAELLERYRPKLEDSGIALTYRACDGELPVEADQDRISQVVLNLLTNAEKYGAAGKEVSVEASRHGGFGCIAVSDRGSGVAPGRERKIFEKFFRGDDALSSGIQGSGLGLTIARQLARAHGGDITYARREGGGSTFTLKLPLK